MPESITYRIPDWDTFINSPVETGDKYMLIMAMGILDEMTPDTTTDELWNYLRSMAVASANEINNDEG